MTYFRDEVMPAVAVLVVALLSAFGALALILDLLFLFLPPVILHFLPLGLSLFFYFTKQHRYLYITAGIFVLVFSFLLVASLPKPADLLDIGWSNFIFGGASGE